MYICTCIQVYENKQINFTEYDIPDQAWRGFYFALKERRGPVINIILRKRTSFIITGRGSCRSNLSLLYGYRAHLLWSPKLMLVTPKKVIRMNVLSFFRSSEQKLA